MLAFHHSALFLMGPALPYWQPQCTCVTEASICLPACHDTCRLSLPLQVVAIVGRQPLLWVVPPGDVRLRVSELASTLGLEGEEALGFVGRLPIVTAFEPEWIKLR